MEVFMSNNELYTVVINHELQYSIWKKDKELPLGWESNGFVGSKDECLDLIEKEWTDMRPLSIREASK
ncbi:MbtH family NRPS accessory protein [Cytobacillus horneckiae]|nr:MbtH family NRPS accessory protein [Cytobacillus horneckiae]